MIRPFLLLIIFVHALIDPLSSQDQTISWATFLSGSAGESVQGLAVNSSGQIVFTGFTSSEDLPLTDDALFSENPDEFGFIGVLDMERQLEYLTYFPFDNPTDILFMDQGRYAVCGQVSSEILPITENALQSDYGGGSMDGFIAVFSEDNQLLYCSYVGGSGEDQIMSLEVDSENNLYLNGYTYSSNMSTTGAFSDTQLNGGSDAFMMKISPQFELVWASYFGGSAGEIFVDAAMGTMSDLYILGRTGSTSGIATEDAAFPEMGGNVDYMLLKLNKESGEIIWSTYIGGEGAESFDGTVLFDPSTETIFVGGNTPSETNIHANTEEGTELMGFESGMLMAFNSGGAQLWGRYFGGPSGAYCKHILLRSEEIVMLGSTLSQSGIVMGVEPLEDQIIINGHYLAAFSIETGLQQWGTYFNANTGIAVQSATIMDSEVLMAGEMGSEWENSFSDVLTSDAFQPFSQGSFEGFLMGIQINIPTSVTESAASEAAFEIYPNPSSAGELYITLPEPMVSQANVAVYTSSGQLLFSGIMPDNAGKLSLGKLTPGMYLIQIRTVDRLYTQKLMVE